ncbi:Lrp/AsnC family transcriptional regulator [Candidatus Woesearchaeota archaeon]|nr:Lrp/AsnC family transcriptional regulator [Nanoarchaeota archaeon]MCB9370499.1 Lrp/AsnC family transcriptional regulator [Candidatus Woesearchaeota archaeon]USN43577.1 MAG: Lrp/AsnC family transcriptional regulator [Candidatus Woesearchaeota archaeon]
MELKEQQKKLLKLLATNARYKNKDIAKILRLSEDSIAYNKDEMFKKKLFTYSIFFDYRKLGYHSKHYFISLKNYKKTEFEKISKIKNVSFINTYLGKYKAQIIFLHKDEKEYEEILTNIRSLLKDNIVEELILDYQTEIKLSHILPSFDVKTSFPKNKKDKFYALTTGQFVPEKWETGYKVDKKDLILIKELLENPTLNLSELSTKTRLSRDTIRKKITQFIDDKFLLHIGIFPNIKAFGYFSYGLLMNVKEIDKKATRNFVHSHNYVFYLEFTQTEKKLLLYIWAKTPTEFSKYYKEIEDFFSPHIESIELLFFDDLLFQFEFPNSLLK